MGTDGGNGGSASDDGLARKLDEWRIGRRAFLIGGTAFAAACSSNGSEQTVSEGSDGGGGSGDGAAVGQTTETADPTEAEAGDLALAPPGSAGLVDEAWWQSRVEAYLGYATAELSLTNVTSVNAHLARESIEPGFTWPSQELTPESFESTLVRFDEWQDTRDFSLMYFLFLMAFGGPEAGEAGEVDNTGDASDSGEYGPVIGNGSIPADVIAAIDERLLADRYRYDDPLPADRVDNMWYWSENHRIINLANEYLVGQRLPNEVFEVTGMTGAEHQARARPDLLEFIREKGQIGWFEWHSNVYMAKNITPLLMLVELADDPEVVNAAAMALDLCLVDMASHYHQGAYVAPHGRTFKKDKTSARDEATYDMAKMMFDRTPTGFERRTSTTATYFCMARRYRPPQLVLDIAQDAGNSVVRERHGLFVDATEPISDNPVAPLGYDFNDRDNMLFWWSAGALGLWQMQKVNVAEADAHRLWEVEGLADVKLLADVQNGDVEAITNWVHERYMILNLGFLSEANTYAWRSDKVSLASVQDHRKGEMRDQVHIWQATIDPDARVFTTHPMTDTAESTNWRDDEIPGYWTGDASMPRTVQHERTAVHIYSPLYTAETDPLLAVVFNYEQYTHAFFPQDHFDEVTQVGHWTIGTKNGGHIALWSWREPTWREYDPDVLATDGMVKPFDLQALGGADNVWITEVGSTTDPENPLSFEDFVAGMTANEPTVTGSGADHTLAVEWSSPAAGEISFGWDTPFIVDGAEAQISDFPRHESKWGTVERLNLDHRWQSGSSSLALDFETNRRVIS